MVVVMWAVATVAFVAVRATGDPVYLAIGSEDVPKHVVEEMRAKLGLDRPLLVQYGDFLSKIAPHRENGSWEVLDIGDSLASSLPVRSIIADRLPKTMLLGGAALSIAIVFSIVLGVFAAVSTGRLTRLVTTVLTLMGQTIPNFLVGLFLILLVSVEFGLLPSFGYRGWQSMILPAVALAAYPAARLARVLRSQILEASRQEYVVVARAKGLAEGLVWRRHVIRNALIPWATMLGVDFGNLIGGSIVIETVFAWPGIGNQLILSITARDYPVVQGIVIVLAGFAVLGNLLADIALRQLDPRIRY